jgi:hypothetical protein
MMKEDYHLHFLNKRWSLIIMNPILRLIVKILNQLKVAKVKVIKQSVSNRFINYQQSMSRDLQVISFLSITNLQEIDQRMVANQRDPQVLQITHQ